MFNRFIQRLSGTANTPANDPTIANDDDDDDSAPNISNVSISNVSNVSQQYVQMPYGGGHDRVLPTTYDMIEDEIAPPTYSASSVSASAASSSTPDSSAPTECEAVLSFTPEQDGVPIAKSNGSVEVKILANIGFSSSTKTPTSTPESRVPLDILFLVDNSGSMAGGKMKSVIASLKCVIDDLMDSDRIALVRFESVPVKMLHFTRMSAAGKEKAIKISSTLNASGGTNMELGLNEAFQLLKDRKHTNTRTLLIALTDGMSESADRLPRCLERLMNEYATKHGSSSLTCHMMGYGEDHDAVLLRKLADIGNGMLNYISSPSLVVEAFAGCLATAADSVADVATLEIFGTANARIEKVIGMESTSTPDNGKSVALRMLMLGLPKEVGIVVSFTPSADQLNKKEVICSGTLKFKTSMTIGSWPPGSNMHKGDDGVVRLTIPPCAVTICETETNPLTTKKDDVVATLMKLAGADAIREATQLENQGNSSAADAVLNNTINNFTSNLSKVPTKYSEQMQNMVKDMNAMKAGSKATRQANMNSAMTSYGYQVQSAQYCGTNVYESAPVQERKMKARSNFNC